MKSEALATVERQETEDAIYRVDTVPPPNSGDAYSAPTEVRKLPDGIIELLKSLKSDRDADLVQALTGATTPASPAPPVTIPPESGVVAKKMYTQWEEGDGDDDPPTRLCAEVVADVLADSERAPELIPSVPLPAPPRLDTIRPSAPVGPVAPPLGAATALFAITPLPPLPPVDEPLQADEKPARARRSVRRVYADALIFTAAAVVSAGIATLIAFAS